MVDCMFIHIKNYLCLYLNRILNSSITSKTIELLCKLYFNTYSGDEIYLIKLFVLFQSNKFSTQFMLDFCKFYSSKKYSIK